MRPLSSPAVLRVSRGCRNSRVAPDGGNFHSQRLARISTLEFASNRHCRDEAEGDWATAELAASPSQQGQTHLRAPEMRHCMVEKVMLNQHLANYWPVCRQRY